MSEKQPALRPKYAWIEAFAAFLKGSPLEEIAILHAIPLEKLHNKYRAENWSRVALALKGTVVETTKVLTETEAEMKLALVERNREENFEMVKGLRDHARNVIDDLKSGKMMITKVFNTKEGPIEHELDPTPADFTQIANYVKTIHDMSYKALGDVASLTGAKIGDDMPGASKGGLSQSLTQIFLPGAVKAPRADRPEAKVEDAGVVEDAYQNAPELALKRDGELSEKLPFGEYVSPEGEAVSIDEEGEVVEDFIDVEPS